MKKSTLFLFFIMLTIALIIVKLPIELRFQSNTLNYLFVMFLWLTLPIAVWINFFSNKRKVVSFILASIITFFSIVVIFFISLNLTDILKTGSDPSFELIREATKNDKYYRLYRTNGGATTSYGLVLREEKNLPFGLKLVKVLFNKYKAYDAILNFTTPNRLKVKIEPYYDNEKAKERVFVYEINRK